MKRNIWQRVLSLANMGENWYEITDTGLAYDPRITAEGICNYLSRTFLGDTFRVDDAGFPETAIISSEQKVYNVIMDCPAVNEVIARVSSSQPFGAYPIKISVNDSERLPRSALEQILPAIHEEQISAMTHRVCAR